jgi:hypothetical protein
MEQVVAGGSTTASPVAEKNGVGASVGSSVADADADGAVAPQPISRFAMALCSAWVTHRP